MAFQKLHGIRPKKRHYKCIGRNTKKYKFEFGQLLLENSKEEVVLRVTTDNKLTGDSYIKSIFGKPGQKFGALLKITNYLNSCKKKLIFRAMIKSQFIYCTLIRMFSSKKSNNLIEGIHERPIRIVSSEHKSNFENFLE